MGRKEGRDGPKWPAPAKLSGDRVQGPKMGEGRTNERAETDLNGRPLPEYRVRMGKMERKEGRDGPKWPAPAKLRGDRVQDRKMGEGGTNERAETDLNGRPLPE